MNRSKVSIADVMRAAERAGNRELLAVLRDVAAPPVPSGVTRAAIAAARQRNCEQPKPDQQRYRSDGVPVPSGVTRAAIAAARQRGVI